MAGRGKRKGSTTLTRAPEAPKDPGAHTRIAQIKKEETHWSGPVPDPDSIAKYEEVIPGAGDRIIRMAEEQAAHRRTLESTVVAGSIADGIRNRAERRIGQVFGLAIGIAGLSVASYAVYLDRQWAAAAVGGVTLTALVTAFLKSQSSEKSKKEDSEDGAEAVDDG